MSIRTSLTREVLVYIRTEYIMYKQTETNCSTFLSFSTVYISVRKDENFYYNLCGFIIQCSP